MGWFSNYSILRFSDLSDDTYALQGSMNDNAYFKRLRVARVVKEASEHFVGLKIVGQPCCTCSCNCF